jgi:hypothetical protein
LIDTCTATRKRGTHRGVVRKCIAELEAIKDKMEESDLGKVRQLRLNLQEKIVLLGKLDNKIVDEIISERDMEVDIEEANTFKQTIQVAIKKIEEVLTSSSSKGVPPSSAGCLRGPPIRPKLPELSLPRFEGDVMLWKSFWDSYNSAVHRNDALSEVDKFTYLLLASLLRI